MSGSVSPRERVTKTVPVGLGDFVLLKTFELRVYVAFIVVIQDTVRCLLGCVESPHYDTVKKQP
jgi:hypothetical protein